VHAKRKHGATGPRPQSKVTNLRITKSYFILQTMRKYY